MSAISSFITYITDIHFFFDTVTLLTTLAIWCYDRKHQGNLNMSPAQRASYHTSMYVNIESS